MTSNAWPLPTPAELLARIVHRESGFLVIDKPPGLVSAGPPRQIHGEPAPRQSVESLLVAALGRQVWAVHQLDRLTSGLNIFALKSSVVATLSERLKTPGAKRYLAIVHGHPQAPQAIEVPLTSAPHPRTGKLHPAIATMPLARPATPTKNISIPKTNGDTHDLPDGVRYALTHLVRAAPNSPGRRSRPSEWNSDPDAPFAWVEVALETGRQHQVRLHLAHLGHPLVGEALHREPPCELHPRQALHAWRLTLPATPTLPAIELTAPIPADHIALAARLGLPALPA